MIALAFRYLTDDSDLTVAEAIKAQGFLTSHGYEASLPNGVGARRYLSWVTGLTKRRISGIVQKPYR
jgi:hypothetical protein